jgi:hypothetical protein
VGTSTHCPCGPTHTRIEHTKHRTRLHTTACAPHTTHCSMRTAHAAHATHYTLPAQLLTGYYPSQLSLATSTCRNHRRAVYCLHSATGIAEPHQSLCCGVACLSGTPASLLHRCQSRAHQSSSAMLRASVHFSSVALHCNSRHGLRRRPPPWLAAGRVHVGAAARTVSQLATTRSRRSRRRIPPLQLPP